jgi:Transglycosylase SLT domain
VLRTGLMRVLAWLYPLYVIILLGCGGLAIGGIGAMVVLLERGDFTPVASLPPPPQPISANIVLPLPSAISPIFTPSVQYWGSQIVTWGKAYGIDPNLVATVMQIESCGDATVGSSAGAQGLFQVMPFHFQDGENQLDPDTNARAGLEYLRGALIRANGHPGLALAGYNGGYGVIATGWGTWATQTQNYYIWGTGIYLDALHGSPTSPALQDWLNAGGSNLCNQAIHHLTATPTPPVTPTPGPSG